MRGALPAAPITPELADGARRGDRDAIAEIYRCLAPAVVGYLRGAGAPDPENVAGDVFVCVIRGLPQFAGDGDALRTWTFTTPTMTRSKTRAARPRTSRWPFVIGS